MARPRILMVLTSTATMGEGGEPTGLWLEEFATPYWTFVDAGAEVTVASTAGGKVPLDPRSLADDPPSASAARLAAEAPGLLARTVAVDALDAAAFDAVFLPGGHGTMWDLPESAALARLIGAAWREGKVVAAVCHGPAGLLAARDAEGGPLVEGRRVAAFTNAEEDAVGLTEAVPFLLETRLAEQGALIDKAEPFAPHAVADGRLITGQNPASSAPTAKLVLDALGSSVW